MTTFEQNFIIKCLETLSQILSDKDFLEVAIKGFSQRDNSNIRYFVNEKITDYQHWDINELLQFNSAYSEASFQVISGYSNQEHPPIKEINAAQKLLKEKYISKITRETQAQKRINSVINNISQVKDEIKARTNPSGFFYNTAVTASLITTASIATLIYLSH